jgi:hypothetical protein
MKKLLAALALVVTQVGAAPAATIGFDNLSQFASDFSGKKYTENGITLAGNGALFESYFRATDQLYLADSGWGGSTAATFTMASLFNAVSFDLTPSMFNYFIRNTKTGASAASSFANVRVSGYNGAGLVAELVFNMGTMMKQKTYLLGSAFSNLSSLVIGFDDPFLGKVGRNKVAECYAPCSQYRIDNITLAPVPLPAGLTLMVTAIAGIAFLSRRRRAFAAI